MATISAQEVNNLRKITGAGMMDCKEALVQSNGDVQQAIDYLRKKGQKVASKRSDRAANEGLVIAKVNANGNRATIIMLNCETDFVAKNQEFVSLANMISDKVVSENIQSLESLQSAVIDGRSIADKITDLVGIIGEKITLSQYDFVEGACAFAYNHQGNRLASIIALNKKDVAGIEETGKELAMQIAAMSPVAIDKNDVPKDVIEREIEIGKEQARQEGKPENIIEKIAIGKLEKFYKESTLLNQQFVRDNQKTVKQYIQEKDKDLTVVAFKRFMLGE